MRFSGGTPWVLLGGFVLIAFCAALLWLGNCAALTSGNYQKSDGELAAPETSGLSASQPGNGTLEEEPGIRRSEVPLAGEGNQDLAESDGYTIKVLDQRQEPLEAVIAIVGASDRSLRWIGSSDPIGIIQIPAEVDIRHGILIHKAGYEMRLLQPMSSPYTFILAESALDLSINVSWSDTGTPAVAATATLFPAFDLAHQFPWLETAFAKCTGILAATDEAGNVTLPGASFLRVGEQAGRAPVVLQVEHSEAAPSTEVLWSDPKSPHRVRLERNADYRVQFLHPSRAPCADSWVDYYYADRNWRVQTDSTGVAILSHSFPADADPLSALTLQLGERQHYYWQYHDPQSAEVGTLTEHYDRNIQGQVLGLGEQSDLFMVATSPVLDAETRRTFFGARQVDLARLEWFVLEHDGRFSISAGLQADDICLLLRHSGSGAIVGAERLDRHNNIVNLADQFGTVIVKQESVLPINLSATLRLVAAASVSGAMIGDIVLKMPQANQSALLQEVVLPLGEYKLLLDLGGNKATLNTFRLTPERRAHTVELPELRYQRVHLTGTITGPLSSAEVIVESRPYQYFYHSRTDAAGECEILLIASDAPQMEIRKYLRESTLRSSAPYSHRITMGGDWDGNVLVEEGQLFFTNVDTSSVTLALGAVGTGPGHPLFESSSGILESGIILPQGHYIVFITERPTSAKAFQQFEVPVLVEAGREVILDIAAELVRRR